MGLRHLGTSLRHTFEARASEWALGWMLFLWGVILNSSPDALANSRGLKSLLSIGFQDSWALAAILIGGGRLLVLGFNGTIRRSPHLRAAAAFMSGFFWMQISLGLVASGNATTGLAVYPVLLALDSYNVFRAMREAGIIDAEYKRAARNGTDP